jgi:hypothetical protein
MKITRRFAVASLLVIAVAVVLGAPAPASAGKQGDQVSVKLHPPAGSPSPHATGTVALSWQAIEGFAVYHVVGVSVSRLAPNASYYMPVAWSYQDNWGGWHDQVYNVPIQTDARGSGQGGVGGPNWLIQSQLFHVYDASGTVVLTSNP